MDQFTPAFKVSITHPAGAVLQLTEHFHERILAFSLTRNSDYSVDQLTLEFDNRPGLDNRYIATPEQGAVISLALGYGGSSVTALGLHTMGDYEITSRTLHASGSGTHLNIVANPVLLRNQRSKSWSAVTENVAGIIKSIASDYGLNANVDEKLAYHSVNGENQINQSDQSYLTQLAARHDAVLKTSATHINFIQRTPGWSNLAIDPEQVISWDLTFTNRTGFQGAMAGHYDFVNGVQKQLNVGQVKPMTGDTLNYRAQRFYLEQDVAQAALAAQFKAANRKEHSLSLVILGEPSLQPEQTISLRALHFDVDGTWLVDSVTHSYNASGFTSQVQCRKS